MNPLRSVGGKLALALLVVVGGALGIVYLIVVPAYGQSLLNTRLAELRSTLRLAVAQPLASPGEVFGTDAWAQDLAERYTGLIGGLRVSVFSPAPLLEPVADSNGGSSRDVEHDPLVARAVAQGRIVTGEVTRRGSTYAEAALSLGPQGVLLLTTPLTNELDSVAVVRRRVVIAGILATVFAIVIGYTLAALFARRIRRLEAAAERIAGGRFDVPVADSTPDELGQLARAFDAMRRRLASLEHARNEFIANASHELRTPLHSLAGFLELLTGDDAVDPRTQADFLVTMRAQVERLTRLATVLLDLSRLDAGQLSLARERVDLNELAATLVTEVGPRAAAEGHPLELVELAHAHARGDGARVLQIARILTENAIAHTPAGCTVTVEVGVERDRAALAVCDDGPGIPAEATEAVFERFTRLGGGVASGSGLGLAIARELAELMGGRIELESRPGRTRFALVLPAESVAREPVGGLAPAG